MPVSVPIGGRCEVGKYCRSPAILRVVRGPNVLHVFMFLSIASFIVRQCPVVLTVLAVSGHLAYDAVCFVFLIIPFTGDQTRCQRP